MPGEPVADELAQRLSVLIDMIMEDEVDESVTTPSGRSGQLLGAHRRIGRAGQDIAKLAAAAEVALRRYDASPQ